MYIMKVESEFIVPDWVNWMAKDADGEWWYYQNKPYRLSYYWEEDNEGSGEFAYNDPSGGDGWEDSLTEIVRC